MIIKTEARKKARDLRRKGYSIKSIARLLGVSSSTSSLWCRDIELNSEQKKQLLTNARNPFYGRRGDYINHVRNKKNQLIEYYKNLGISEIGILSSRELFILGVGLYWAEGFKKDKRLGFSNTDPIMITLFLRWLIECCNVPKSSIRLRIGINISHAERVEIISDYWHKITKIPKKQFQKPFYQKFIWKKNYPNPEQYHGVLRIRANKQLALFRKINGWIEGLKQNSLKI